MNAAAGDRPLRLFVAWPLPDEARREIGRVVGLVRHDLPAASWPKAESLHVTFAFLGSTPAGRVAGVAAALGPLAGAAAVEVRADRAGFFPNERRPRVAWLGLSPGEGLGAIATAVREALVSAGAGFDEKPFRPHLTLARIKDRWSAREVERFRAAFDALRGPAMRVDRVVLYESRLSPKGATHVALREVGLR